MTLTVLFYIFVGVFFVQILYLIFFLTFCFKKNKIKPENKLPISVLVYAKNNAETINNCIDSLVNQNYPDFEIVIVNNASTDDTPEIIDKLSKTYNNIKIVHVENTEAFWGNKKYALTLGIKAASNNHILFTEANSTPISGNWIQTLNEQFSSSKEIVVAYKKYRTTSKSFVNILARFEHLIKTIFSFSFANKGIAFSAFENNFGYDRNLFFKTKGYIHHLKNKAPHSDLFLKEAVHKKNIAVVTDKDSFVTIDAPNGFKSWYNTLLDKAFTEKYYKASHKFLINLFLLSRVLFYVLSPILIVLNWKISTPFVVFYYLLLFIVVGKGASKFQEKKLLLLLPLLDILLLCIQISIFITQRISKPVAWR